MTSDVRGVVEELRSAFRGPGLRDHSWRQRANRVGNQLSRLVGIDELDSDAVATRKLTEWLRHTISAYVDETQLIVCVVAGMDPAIKHDTLEAREDCLAGKLAMSKRTVQRRVKEALEQLARDGIANRGRIAAAEHRGHVVIRQDVLLELDRDPPVVTERLLVQVTDEKLGEIIRPVSVPRGADADVRFRCEVLEGGRLRTTERRPGELDLLVLHIEPPEVLERGDTHQIKIRYTLSPTPFLVIDPHTRYDQVGFKVRFPADRQPSRVWRLNGATRWETGELLPPDPSGRYEAVFFGLRPGFLYGLRWDWDGPAAG